MIPCIERGRIFGYDVDGYMWPVDIDRGMRTDSPLYLRFVMISEGHRGECQRRLTHARAIIRLVEADSPWLLRVWRGLVTALCRQVYAVGVRAGVW